MGLAPWRFTPSKGNTAGCGCTGSKAGGSLFCITENIKRIVVGVVGGIEGGLQYYNYMGDFFVIGAGVAIAGTGLYTVNPSMVWWGGSVVLSGAVPFVAKLAGASVSQNLPAFIDLAILGGSYMVMKNSAPNSKAREVSQATFLSSGINTIVHAVYYIKTLTAALFQKGYAEITPETRHFSLKGGTQGGFANQAGLPHIKSE